MTNIRLYVIGIYHRYFTISNLLKLFFSHKDSFFKAIAINYFKLFVIKPDEHFQNQIRILR